MKARAVRIGLWLAALSVVTFAAIWLLLPAFVSSAFVRSAIERELADIAGQQIQIEGRVDINLFPAPVARLYDVRVPSETPSPDGAPQDFMVVERLEVSIPFASLLAREPEFSQFRLVRPAIRIQVDEQGRLDLSAIGGRIGREIDRARAKQARDAESAEPTTARTEQARLGRVSIARGTVEFVGPDGQAAERITALRGTISWPRLDERLSASLKGIWRGAAFEQKTEIEQTLQFITGQIVGVRQSFSSDVLTYSFNGNLAVGTAPFAEGQFKLNAPSVRQALDWLGTGIHTGGAVGSLSLSAKMRGDAKKVRFDGMNIALQGSTGTGALELAFKKGQKPSVTATLDFDTVDMPAVLSAFTGMPRTRAAFAEHPSPGLLNQMDADLRLSATAARFGDLALSQIAMVTQIRNGTAVFELPDATAYGGDVQSRLKLADEGGRLTGALGITVNDVDSAAIADALNLTGLLPRGKTTGNIQISAPIEKWSDLFMRADGEVTLNVANGQLNGIAFATLGGEGISQSFFSLRDNSRSSEVFNTLAISARIRNGVVIIDDGNIDYPSGSVQVNGVIPYGTGSLALTTVARPRAEQAPAIQHFIGGSWTSPYAAPVVTAPREP